MKKGEKSSKEKNWLTTKKIEEEIMKENDRERKGQTPNFLKEIGFFNGGLT